MSLRTAIVVHESDAVLCSYSASGRLAESRMIAFKFEERSRDNLSFKFFYSFLSIRWINNSIGNIVMPHNDIASVISSEFISIYI